MTANEERARSIMAQCSRGAWFDGDEDIVRSALDEAEARGRDAGLREAAEIADRADAEWHDMEGATGKEMLAALAHFIRDRILFADEDIVRSALDEAEARERERIASEIERGAMQVERLHGQGHEVLYELAARVRANTLGEML